MIGGQQSSGEEKRHYVKIGAWVLVLLPEGAKLVIQAQIEVLVQLGLRWILVELVEALFPGLGRLDQLLFVVQEYGHELFSQDSETRD